MKDSRAAVRGFPAGLCLLAISLILSAGCGESARKGAARTVSGLPAEVSGGQKGIALSIDPTEVGLIRLKGVVDTLRIGTRAEYRIGPEDVLEISIFARSLGESEKPEEVTVRFDGKVFLSLLGEIDAAGLRIQELQDRLTRDAARFIKDPFVLIKVKEFNSQRVTIFGEIGGGGGGNSGGRAVTVPLRGPTRLVDILSSTIIASGFETRTSASSASPTVNADLSNIIITRRSGERFRVNLNMYLFGLDASANVEVLDGDVIFVPQREDNRVFVLGEVQSPGPVPIGLGMTTTEVISRAGGFKTTARRNDVKLVRGGLIHPEVMNVAVRDVMRTGDRSEDVPLRNGDIVYIPRNPLADVNVLLGQILPALQTFILIQAATN